MLHKITEITEIDKFAFVNRNALKERLIKSRLKTRPEQLNIDKAD